VSSLASHARVTLISQWTRLLIQIVGFVALSRLLTPADFGIVAMVSSIVIIAGVVADFGLSLAGIQAASLSQGEKSSLFFLNAGAGLIAAAVVAASGPALAAFYGEPSVVLVAVVLALPLVIMSLSVQFRVEMTRASRYSALAMQDVVSAGGGLIAAVLAALAGWGYWALAAQSLAQALVLLALATAQARWWPGRPAPLREMRSFLVFGGNSLALQVANLASTTVDVMFVGRAQGPTTLGLYSRASQLVSMLILQIVSPLTRVILPRLSRARDDAEFNRVLHRTQRIVSYPLLAAVSLLAAAAPAGVVVAFGSNWTDMGSIAQILCVGAAFQAIGFIYYWALLARARTGLLLVAELPGRVVMIAGAILAAPIGADAVAAAMSLGQFVILVGSTVLVRRAGVDTIGTVRVALRPLVLAVLCFAAAASVALYTEVSPFIELLAVVAVWLGIAGLSLVVPSVRRDVRSVLASVRG